MSTQVEIDRAKIKQITKVTPAGTAEPKKARKTVMKKKSKPKDYPHDLLAQGMDEYTEVSATHSEVDDADEEVHTLVNSASQEAQIERADQQRLFRKALQFGIEHECDYNQHINLMKGFEQNPVNQVNVTWSQKEIHFWSNEAKNVGEQYKAFKILDIAQMHTQVTCITYSRYFRLYIVFTADFKIFVMNEKYKVVTTIEMTSINLVNFAYVYDDPAALKNGRLRDEEKTKENEKYSFHKVGKIVLGNIDEVTIMDFDYKSNHTPFLSSKIDQEGRHIKVDFANPVKIEDKDREKEGMDEWVKGMRVHLNKDGDTEDPNLIISWKKRKIMFNYLEGPHMRESIY